MSREQHSPTLLAMNEIACDLTRALSSSERYGRLLETVRRLVDSDAASLMRMGKGVLHPVAAIGLSPDVLGRTFAPKDHPRLEAILSSPEPVIFPADDPRPDPFDGLVAHDWTANSTVHSCMGCTLYDGSDLIGVLTLDALEAGRFDDLDRTSMKAFASLAAAALRTAELIDRLENTAEHCGQVARSLVTDALRRRGGGLLGQTEVMVRVRREIEVVAPSDLTVLITGETGTGKEIVARSLHSRSNRRDQPLVYVNCAALPESIAESELFGHVRGAFTGASRDRKGKFELAHNATLFLDEVAELPVAIQTKLLRALQFGEIQRVGSDRHRIVDVRIIAATNRILETEIVSGKFRDDLFHRLNGYPIHVPPLRERQDDVLLLTGHLLDRARLRLGLGRIRMTPDAQQRLLRYDWPGNVRELEHTLLRAALRASGGRRKEVVTIEPTDLLTQPQMERQPGGESGSPHGPVSDPHDDANLNLAERVISFKRRVIEDTVRDTGGNWAQAARRLGVDRGNLYRTAQRLGLI